MKRKIKLTESQLYNIIREGVKHIINENAKYQFFVADEGDGIYNIFSYDDFDENGCYYGHSDWEGYNIEDFDIVYECNSFAQAERWIDKHRTDFYE